MRAITLNQASRPFRNNAVVGSVVGGIAALLVLATAYNLYVYISYGGSYTALQEKESGDRRRLASLETEERQLQKELQTRDFKTAWQRGAFAGEVILKRSFSWTLLFNKLEGVVPAEVMMTAIRPNITEKGIVIYVTGIAKHHGALLDFEDALLKNAAFTRVYPASERRINPSRPDITFALTCDYLPAREAPPANVVAAAAGGTAPATAPAAAPSPSSAPAAAGPTAPARTQEPPRPVIGVVGRDGRVRTEALLARMVAAPGGVYPPPPAGATKPAAGASSSSRSTDPAQDASRSAGTAPAGGGSADPRPASKPPASGAGPADPMRAGGALVSPAAAAALPLPKGEPGQPPPLAQALRADRPRAASTPAPAVRLDVPLNFWQRPVGEAYDALARAHGVRFDLDPAVNRLQSVNANLSGRKLEEALAILGKAAGHRISRATEGVYRVAPLAGGEPIGEAAPREETLPPAEGAP